MIDCSIGLPLLIGFSLFLGLLGIAITYIIKKTIVIDTDKNVDDDYASIDVEDKNRWSDKNQEEFEKLKAFMENKIEVKELNSIPAPTTDTEASFQEQKETIIVPSSNMITAMNQIIMNQIIENLVSSLLQNDSIDDKEVLINNLRAMEQQNIPITSIMVLEYIRENNLETSKGEK